MATLPTYPGVDGFPLQFDSTGRSFRPDVNTSDFKNLNAAGLKIWNESHAVDPTLGGAPYGSAAWQYQFVQNGKANSISVPLPFPQMIGLEDYFPKYTAGATVVDFAPGENVLSKCDQYKADGALAVADFKLKYGAYGDTDILPGTVITKAQGITNVKVNYNQEAQAHGCTVLPFPEAAGMSTVAAEPPVNTNPPRPKTNVTLNGVPLDENGVPVTGGPYPGNVNDPVPVGPSSGVGSGPVTIYTASPSGPNPGMPPRPLTDAQVNLATTGTLDGIKVTPTTDNKGLWIVAGAVVLFLAIQGDK